MAQGVFSFFFSIETELTYNIVLVSGVLHTDFGEGNGTPLQYSCLQNPMDGGAW